MRTPTRWRAEAIVSPASIGTVRPSRSSDCMDLVRSRVALDGEPAPAARVVEPALALESGCVRSEPDSLELLLARIGDLAPEPELGVLPAAAARTHEPEDQASAL